MSDKNPMEIPKEMRELAERNISQARAAYAQLMEATVKAQEMLKSLAPSTPIAEGLGALQERAMRFTQQNLDASFALANELAKAKDLTEALQIQNRHAQLQMHAYSLQAQELSALMNDLAKKAQSGS
ncbi:MAG TPA: phasin family protein [Hyphomicrobiales bacterium]|nr:phasin family protein [Hyphomicrobiales bacterium]